MIADGMSTVRPMSNPSINPVNFKEWAERRWREGYLLLYGKTYEEFVRDEQLNPAALGTADSDDGCVDVRVAHTDRRNG